LVVRCEVDACLPYGRPSPLSSIVLPAPPLRDPSINIIRAGSLAPQTSLLELKTKKYKPDKYDPTDWREQLPQLVLSGTPSHIVGLHQDGNFTQFRRSTVGSPELAAAEARGKQGMKKLHVVLTILQQVLAQRGHGKKFSLVCKSRTLRVYERQGLELLPARALARFEL
jgi:hypothetical protein